MCWLLTLVVRCFLRSCASQNLLHAELELRAVTWDWRWRSVIGDTEGRCFAGHHVRLPLVEYRIIEIKGRSLRTRRNKWAGLSVEKHWVLRTRIHVDMPKYRNIFTAEMGLPLHTDSWVLLAWSAARFGGLLKLYFTVFCNNARDWQIEGGLSIIDLCWAY